MDTQDIHYALAELSQRMGANQFLPLSLGQIDAVLIKGWSVVAVKARAMPEPFNLADSQADAATIEDLKAMVFQKIFQQTMYVEIYPCGTFMVYNPVRMPQPMVIGGHYFLEKRNGTKV